MIKKKRKYTVIKIRNERENITTEFTEIKMIIRKY